MRTPLLICAGTVAALTVWKAAAARPTAMEALLATYRPFELHLATSPDRACPETTRDVPPVGKRYARQIECERISADLARRLHAVAARYRGSGDSAALGRLDLLTAGADTVLLDRAIRFLGGAAQMDSNAAVLNDLAVAYAVRGVRLERPLDLYRALDLTLRALTRDSAHPAARHNRHRLLARLALNSAPQAGGTEPGPPDPRVIREDSAAAALARWADAILSGDTARAAAHADELEKWAGALAGDDGTVAGAVVSIRRAGPDDRQRLANGYRAFLSAETLFRGGNHEASADLYREAARRLLPLGDPYGWWSELGEAAVRVYEGESPASILQRVQRSADAARYPAVHGRAHRIRGVWLIRRGYYDAALKEYEAGAAQYREAGEAPSVAALEWLAGESLVRLGQREAAERILTAAAERFVSSPDVSYHDLLLFLGRYLLEQELPHAALVVHTFGEEFVRLGGRPDGPAEVAIRYAQAAIRLGRYADATQRLSYADSIYRQVASAAMVQRGQADLLDTRAALLLATRPAEAATLLGSTIEYFRPRNSRLAVRALLHRAEAWAQAGNAAAAAADLVEAKELVGAELDALGTRTDSLLFRTTVTAIYARLAAMQLDAGDAGAAFATAGVARGLGDLAGSSETRALLAPGDVLMRYAVLADRLVVWRVNDREIFSREVAMPRAALEREVNAFVAALINRDSVAATPAAEHLYALLLGGASPPAGRLIIQPDGVLGALPFAALRSPTTHRFLLEESPIILGLGHASADEPPASDILAFDASDFDRASFPALPALPAAAAEVATAGELHRRAELVQGTRATARALRTRLGKHDIFHFAGHAWAHPTDADRSYLVLAADEEGRSLLHAADIARMSLRKVRLAILSACSSARDRDARSADVGSLAHAFLDAGAGAVIGSVWDVNDATTATLFQRFHARLSAGDTPERALRAAQLELMHSHDAELRAPRAWAGFQLYLGR